MPGVLLMATMTPAAPSTSTTPALAYGWHFAAEEHALPAGTTERIAPPLVVANDEHRFIVAEHLDLWPQALAELGNLVAEGKLKYRESVAQGIESAPKAFLGMLKGENFGKQIVKM